MDKYLREMAKILLVDRIATEQENDNGVFAQIDAVYGCGSELMESVPDTLANYGVSLDSAIELLLPEMRRIVALADEKMQGLVTMERLGQINERVYTTLALNSAGHGLSIKDEEGIEDALRAVSAEEPRGIYLNDSALDDAVYLVEEALQASLEK